MTMQGPLVIYTDTPRKHKHILPAIFATLGTGLMPGDSGVRGDTFHLFQHLQDTFTPGHSHAEEAVSRLKEYVWTRDATDFKIWLQEAGRKPGDKPPLSRVRHYTAQPPELRQQLVAWRDQFRLCMDPSLGKQLFTEDTLSLFNLTLQDIDAWFYSGESHRRCVALLVTRVQGYVCQVMLLNHS